MQQLLLDLETTSPPTLETFLPGQNAEVLHLFRQIANGQSHDHFVYIWGDSAVGKTHLLKAMSRLCPAKLITPMSPAEDFAYDPHITLYLLDDCDKLSAEKQITAFDLFNQIRENARACMITAGTSSPLVLTLRDDLKSRLCWGLVYQIKGLTDEEKIAALTEQARHRGFTLSQGVLPYLITHYQRDMHSLSMILDALDRYSLQTKRTITLPLLYDLLQKKQEPIS